MFEWFHQQVWGVSFATAKVEKQLIMKSLLVWLFNETNCVARRLPLNQVLSTYTLKKYCKNCQRGWVN